MLLDSGVNHFRVEAHGSDVERIPVFQARRSGFHQRDSRIDGIGHIHHVHKCTRLYGTYELLAFHGRVEDVYRIVRRTATRGRHVGDDAGEAYRTGIHPVFRIIIIA